MDCGHSPGSSGVRARETRRHAGGTAPRRTEPWSMALRARTISVIVSACLALAPLAGPPPALAATRYLDPVFASVSVGPDVVYGSALNVGGVVQDLLLNVYEPAGDLAPSRIALVFAHGGGFTGGSRKDARIVDLVTGWAQRGFVVVNIDYRVRPGKFIGELVAEGLVGMSPTMTDAQHDMQAAVRWTRANASTLRIDPDHIVAGGESAGAITAWQTGINADDPGGSGNPGYPSNVSAVLSLWGAAMPPHIGPGSAPVIDLHGQMDTTVPEGFAAQACALMIAWGNGCERVLWPTERHTSFHRAEEIRERTSSFACRHAIPGCAAETPPPVQVVP